MPGVPIALQLYSVRGECGNLPATLKAVAEAGYLGAEPWGYKGDGLAWMNHPAKDIRRMYDDNGLKCCGIHLSTEALLGDNLSRTIEFNQILGNRFLIIAMDKTRMSSSAGIVELAGILNRVAEKLAPLGMFSGYHAHGFDFDLVDGRTAWDTLFSQTRPEVIMQLDIGNCASGGGDPIATLRKFAHRARSLHLKDYGGAKESVIGQGTIDWAEVFRLCDTQQNVEWYVVEEGSDAGTGFEIPRRSLQALRRMGR